VIGTAEAAPYDGSAPLKRRPTSDRHRRSGALRVIGTAEAAPYDLNRPYVGRPF